MGGNGRTSALPFSSPGLCGAQTARNLTVYGRFDYLRIFVQFVGRFEHLDTHLDSYFDSYFDSYER
jgi:hypothetical protein